ncbi:cobalamin-binding protein [Scytonema millei]|uniref:Cobalamin-binding protein n=1 Tax=Scytonema millei VB511283 TaxID=1245923 RepID=A0A9X5EA66_9CYAN|nr:cobalamin-binding protein [Scytonema millei]NHC38135.1 cobalamin-binding protein [Scytonema millei VB511283]
MKEQDLRIVSLIPSATEILAALGLTDAVVGRSHECDFPPEILDRPACTRARINSNGSSAEIHQDVDRLIQSALSIYQIETDLLEQLQPTHIVTQDQCDVCAVSLGEVEKAVANLTHSQPHVISLQPNVLADVWADIERVAQTLGVDANRLIENIQSRIEICRQKVRGLSVSELPTVVCIEWIDPLMVASNWIPELVAIAGGQSLFSVSGQASAQVRWENLIAADPSIIVVMPCGLDLNRTQAEILPLTQRPEWQHLRAVKSGRVYATDGNAYFNRPGPRLVDSLEILAEILHPEIFSYGYKGTAWEQIQLPVTSDQ